MCQHIKSYVINFVLSQVFQIDFKKILKTFLRTAPRDLSLNSVRHNLRQLMISPKANFHFGPSSTVVVGQTVGPR